MTTAALAGTAVLFVGVASACGGAAGTSTPTSSPSTADASTTPPSSASPSASPPRIRLKQGTSLDVPDSWRVDPEDAGIIAFNDPGGKFTCTLAATSGVPTSDKPTKQTIASLARNAMPNEPNNRRAADVVIDGTRMYHLIGKDEAAWHDEYGTVDHGYLLTVSCDGSIMLAPRSWQIKQLNRLIGTFRLG